MKGRTFDPGGLPKFDSVPWLIGGAVFSILLFGLDLWALLSQWSVAFFPYQLSKGVGMAIGVGLAIHCVDMTVYYLKRPRQRG